MFIDRRFSRLAAAGIVALVAGCQGAPDPVAQAGRIGIPAGIAEHAAAAVAQPGMGTIDLNIRWPRRTQAIPASANLIVITIYDALEQVVSTTRIRRPEVPDDVISHAAISLPAATRLEIWARAYRQTELTGAEVPVAVGMRSTDVYDNIVTKVDLEMRYIDISLTSISPTNGGEGVEVTFLGSGFYGFVDPHNATPSARVYFPHRTVREDPLSGVTLDNQFSDLWIRAQDATRSADGTMSVLVPDGAVNGVVDLRVDGLSALHSPANKSFTVLEELEIKGNGPTLQGVPSLAVRPGDAVSLTAVATDSVGKAFGSPTVSWFSSDPAVAYVEKTTGALKARTVGSARITARTGKLVASANCFVLNQAGTASFIVDLPIIGSTTSLEFDFPAYEGGNLTGTATP
jgi:hypothetical protein